MTRDDCEPSTGADSGSFQQPTSVCPAQPAVPPASTSSLSLSANTSTCNRKRLKLELNTVTRVTVTNTTSVAAPVAGTQAPANLSAHGQPSHASCIRHTCPLASPDVRMLKLASPDVERFLMQDVHASKPGPVAEPHPDADNYGLGFDNALRQLKAQHELAKAPQAGNNGSYHLGAQEHGQQPPPPPPTPLQLPLSQQQPVYTYCQQTGAPTGGLEGGCVLADPKMYAVGGGRTRGASTGPLMKPESEVSATTPAPAMAPHLSDQESIKLEKKRMRNRMAATKCRHRKLERIAHLETQVDFIRRKNTELMSQRTKLRQQIEQMQREIHEHTQRGCQIVYHSNVSA